jgi:hypothetical protein
MHHQIQIYNTDLLRKGFSGSKEDESQQQKLNEILTKKQSCQMSH